MGFQKWGAPKKKYFSAEKVDYSRPFPLHFWMRARRISGAVYCKRIGVCLACLGLPLALYSSLRHGVAALLVNSQSSEEISRAAGMEPGNAAAWKRLAQVKPAEHDDAIRHALAANPHDALLWVDAGLRYEAQGDDTNARKYLVRAMENDRGFLPAWTLANYAVRHNDPEFWNFARRSLEIALAGGQDPAPIYSLAADVAKPHELLSRLVGANPSALRTYLTFLLNGKVDSDIEGASMALAPQSCADDLRSLLSACERLRSAQSDAAAWKLWSAIAARKLLPFPAPAEGEWISNGTLAQPLQTGYDWRYNSTPGSPLRFTGDEVSIDFTGNQPERLELIFQPLAALPARNLTLRWQAQCTAVKSRAGLFWMVMDLDSQAVLFRVPLRTPESWREQRATFSLPSGVRRARLVLQEERLPGEQRFEGTVAVKNVSLRAI